MFSVQYATVSQCPAKVSSEANISNCESLTYIYEEDGEKRRRVRQIRVRLIRYVYEEVYSTSVNSIGVYKYMRKTQKRRS